LFEGPPTLIDYLMTILVGVAVAVDATVAGLEQRGGEPTCKEGSVASSAKVYRALLHPLLRPAPKKTPPPSCELKLRLVRSLKKERGRKE
jgi:hypothetical protein